MICFPHSLQSINIIAIIIPLELSDLKTWILRRWEYKQNLNYTPAFLKLILYIYFLNVFSNAKIGYLLFTLHCPVPVVVINKFIILFQ